MKTPSLAKGLGWLAAGAAIGGAVAILVTPRSGRAMRRALRKEARYSRESVAHLAGSVARECRSAYDSGRGAAGRLVSWTRRASA